MTDESKRITKSLEEHIKAYESMPVNSVVARIAATQDYQSMEITSIKDHLKALNNSVAKNTERGFRNAERVASIETQNKNLNEKVTAGSLFRNKIFIIMFTIICLIALGQTAISLKDVFFGV